MRNLLPIDSATSLCPEDLRKVELLDTSRVKEVPIPVEMRDGVSLTVVHIPVETRDRVSPEVVLLVY
jgi:hypothetical protein